MQANKKKILITGTNRGIGKACVEILYKQHPQFELHITSRNPANQFSEEWKKEFPNHSLVTYQLEVTNNESLKENASLMKNNNISFDVIIVNAGFGWDPGYVKPSQQTARKTLGINVNATITFIREFLPLLSPTGRIIILSSDEGSIDKQPAEIQQKVQNPNITEQEILWIAQDYIQSVVNGDMKNYNWSSYKTSKVLMNAWTRFILTKLISADQKIFCVDPGWCKTDMGTSQAPQSAKDGAERVLKGIWIQEIDHNRIYNNKYCDYFTCI